MDSYKPLTEEFRPYNLDDIVGQDTAVELLKHDVESGEYKPLYLATGPFGSGKTTAARAFARAANCLNRDGTKACGECENCVEMDRKKGVGVPFYVEIDASNYSKVENVRDLMSSLRHSARGLRRFVVLDECHNLSRQAMDTLLKPTEDPSSTYSFIFVTSEFHKISKGIVTRSTRLPFNALETPLILNRLQEIVEKKGLEMPEGKLLACAERSMGSMRQALKNLERAAILGESLVLEDEGELWEEFLDCLYDKDLAGALVGVAGLLDQDTISAQDVLNRAFTEVRDGIISGDKRWGGEHGTHAITELSRASAKMNSSGTDRIALEAGIVSMLNPPHKDLERYVRRSVAEALKGVDFGSVEITCHGSDGAEGPAGAGDTALGAGSAKEEAGGTGGAPAPDSVPEVSTEGGPADAAEGGGEEANLGDKEDTAQEGEAPENQSVDDEEDVWKDWAGDEAISAIAEAESARLKETFGEDSADPEEIAENLMEIEALKERMKTSTKVEADTPEEARDKIREMGKEEYARKVADRLAGTPDIPEKLGDGSEESVIDALRSVRSLAKEDDRVDVLEVLEDIVDVELQLDEGDPLLLVYTDSGEAVASLTRDYIEEALDVDIAFDPDMAD